MVLEGNSLRERFNETICLRKSTGEIGVLVFLGVLGLFATIYSQLQLPLENPLGAGVGPRLFPQLAGVTMVMMSVYLLIMRIRGRKKGTLDDETISMQVRDGLRVLVFIIFCLGYMAVFEEVGFGVSTIVLLFLLFITNGFRRYVLAGALAIGFTITIYSVFTIGLGLPLPSPVLNDLLGGYF